MVNEKEAIAAVEALFRGLTETNMREIGLEAIRRSPSYQKSEPHPFMISPHNWFRDLLRLLSPGTPIESANPTQLDINSMVAAPYVPKKGQLLAYHEPVYRFWAWMEQAGFAISVRHEDKPDGSSRAYPIYWMITTLGLTRLQDEHPLQPGAMERLWQAFGTTHEDSLARLEDAHTCFDRGLWRPAVVLLGLAYEELLITMAQRMSVSSKLNAKDRLDELRKAIERHKNGDRKTAALSALNVANAIREARNDAAHKASSTWTATEVDELLADGMRAYAKIAGYVPTP